MITKTEVVVDHFKSGKTVAQRSMELLLTCILCSGNGPKIVLGLDNFSNATHVQISCYQSCLVYSNVSRDHQCRIVTINSTSSL